jgi:hypothetical protein
VEVVSQIWFVIGVNRCQGCKVVSIALLPVTFKGVFWDVKPALPEIFLQ